MGAAFASVFGGPTGTGEPTSVWCLLLFLTAVGLLAKAAELLFRGHGRRR